MPFRRVTREQDVPDSPLDLFYDLRPRQIEAPYDQQAQLLRDYHESAVDISDVAIQGATGSGKTLIGLIIAEWRRRRGERAVYLCPTRQLVHQVARFGSEKLGMPVRAFTGPSAEFSQDDKTRWRRGDIVGIAPYSALFNVNPFFAEPGFIVADDAHAADQYIAEYWTVRVLRSEHESLFRAITDQLEGALPRDEIMRLREEPSSLSDHLWVQVVPAPAVWAVADEISAILDRAGTRTDLGFRWSVVKNSFPTCQMFVSPYEILLRPILPPTSSHRPFADARQRLFMSATLGRGGELERLSGRKSIHRLPAPRGWDGHGVGRRFFMFPHASLDERQTTALFTDLVRVSQRALFLVPSERAAEAARGVVHREIPEASIFGAREIEETKEPFINAAPAVAVIANRYDGIDFPQDECRLMIVEGRPTGTSLQERFLSEKLGASALFAERVRTRIVQAFGRCTRSATDYALVLVVGDKLMEDLFQHEYKAVLDRELQAELEFGQQQSMGQTKEGFFELAQLFFPQADEWRDVEGDIVALRNRIGERVPDAVEELAAAAPHEIEYVERSWAGRHDRALEAAEQVLGALTGGNALRGYRAMWHYLAGCAALADAKEAGETDSPRAAEHFRRARSIVQTRWLSGLERSAGGEPDGGLANPEDLEAIERIEQELWEMGLAHARGFTKREGEIQSGLAQNQSETFERAHVDLGRLLGFRADNSEDSGAPDPWWVAGDRLCFVFEDHSNATPGNALPLDKARQAASHVGWIRENVRELADTAEINPVLVTPADVSSPNVQTHLSSVVVWPLEEFRAWARDALSAVRRIRTTLHKQGDLAWRADALSILAEANATPSSLREMLLEHSRGGTGGTRQAS